MAEERLRTTTINCCIHAGGADCDCACHDGEEERAEISRLRERVRELTEDLGPWTAKLLRQYVDDTSDGFECLPKCDSYGHEDMCPVTNTVAAFRLLRGQLAEAQKRIAELEAGLTAYQSMSQPWQLQERIAQLEAALRQCLQSITHWTSDLESIDDGQVTPEQTLKVVISAMEHRMTELKQALAQAPDAAKEEK